MNNIGSKISSAINPFKGTVNTEKTSNKKLTFHGTECTLDLGSTGNFALRKIYNSIVNAPGHAFNAVKSFTNYLYGNNGDAQVAPLHDAQVDPLHDAQVAAQVDPLHDAEAAAKDKAATKIATKISALYRGNKGREEAKAIAEEKEQKAIDDIWKDSGGNA
ncbi:MAG: hypothetical protein QE493_02505 [Verrucomicrobiae bacterium]|nr:hypothetical protein [Verrucomicrobiae bacterium]